MVYHRCIDLTGIFTTVNAYNTDNQIFEHYGTIKTTEHPQFLDNLSELLKASNGQNGGKRKTRRNRKRPQKSRKNRRKSHRTRH